MKKRLTIIAVWLMIMMVTACSPKKKIIQDPFHDSFFEKSRLIMTSEELSIYKHLPDEKSKKEFIKEFWEKRDPTMETEENENKMAFEERIKYANRWFREGKGSDTGWGTERGRILLQLGFPDRREFGDYTRTHPMTGALLETKRYPMERWYYYRYQLGLVFVDMNGFGKLRLIRVPATLLTALDLVKFTLDLRNKSELKRAFKFNAKFGKDALQIEIPVKKLSLEENNDKMMAKFNIEVYIYRNYKKIDKITEEKVITKSREEMLDTKTLSFTIPYSPSEKGSYYFDVIIEEVLTSSKYRNFCKAKKRLD
ncbi:MAG: GWxTD domain-containing protein [Candidatus Aminicenantes bacterium]|nr:GWxTD domain-containing protein [Candidatus Aminicenantes bacterium]